ncbi:MAG: hypothetical protein QF464_24450 [Myxococcota bacterium]|nr:hypothetical protein [Myxococcota bacterium]
MAAYTCEKCGMGVSGMTCAKCGQALVHGILVTDSGAEVHVSKCPDGCGKIKSPQCCGDDMCSI